MSNTDQLYKPYSTKSIDSQSSYTGRYLKIFDEQAKNRIGSYNFLNEQKGQQLKSYTDRNNSISNVIFEDENESLVYDKSQKDNKSKQIFGDLERMRNQHVKMMEIMEEKPIELSNKLSQIQNQFKRKSIQSYVPQFGSLTNYQNPSLEYQQNKSMPPINFNQINFAKPNIQQNISTPVLVKQISFEPRFTFAPQNPIDFSNNFNQDQTSQKQIHSYIPPINFQQNNQKHVQTAQQQINFPNEIYIQKQKQHTNLNEQIKSQQVNCSNNLNLTFPKIVQFNQQENESKLNQNIYSTNQNTKQIEKQIVNKNVIINETKNVQIQPIAKEDTTQIYLQQESNIQNKNEETDKRIIKPINQQVTTKQQHVVNYAQQYQQYIANSYSPNPRIINAIQFVKEVEDKMKKYSHTMQQLNKIQPNSYLNKQNLHISNQYRKPQMQFQKPFVDTTVLQNIEQVESIVSPPVLPIYQNVNISSNNIVHKPAELSHKVRNTSPYKRISPQPTLRNLNINHNFTPQIIKQNNNIQYIQPGLRKRVANIAMFHNTPAIVKNQIIRPSSHDPRFSTTKRILTQPTFYASEALPIQHNRNSRAQHILQPNNLTNPIINQHIIINRPTSSHIIPSKTVTYQPVRVNFSPLKDIHNYSPLIFSNSTNNANKPNIQRSNIHKRPASTGISLVSTRR